MPAPLQARLVAAVMVVLAAEGCASSGVVPRPFPAPGSAPVVPTDAFGASVAGTALSMRGVPYRNGGSDPSGFDCSGFVWYVFAQHGRELPRTVGEQYRQGSSVQPAELQVGDLVFFRTSGPGPSHVGIMIDGEAFVHAPSTKGEVRVERLSAKYWNERFAGARRVDGQGPEAALLPPFQAAQ